MTHLNSDSSWKFEMTSANEPGAWMLMKVSLVISGPSGPDELTNCLTWNDIDWLWLRYQVMFWPWTGFVTSFDLLNTHDYDKLLRIVLIHINYHNNILIILVNLRMLWNNMGVILIQVETSLHHFNMFEYTQPYFV